MRIAIVHLSDMHFRTSGNPISERASHVVPAAASLDPSVKAFGVKANVLALMDLSRKR
jgi:hypothetical protein